MARIVPLDPVLVQMIRLRPGEGKAIELLRLSGDLSALAAGSGGVVIEGGLVLGAGGVIPLWPGRAGAWMIAGADSKPHHLLLALRWLRGFLDELQHDTAYRRIECTVKDGFAPGMRWAAMLGFAREGLMPGYAPDGSAHHLFARMGAAAPPWASGIDKQSDPREIAV